ncbi:MAG: hypothetical protein MHMPM18_003657 [Marteilia pararefringens]
MKFKSKAYEPVKLDSLTTLFKIFSLFITGFLIGIFNIQYQVAFLALIFNYILICILIKYFLHNHDVAYDRYFERIFIDKIGSSILSFSIAWM